MLRCAASFVIAAYPKVRFIPQDLRALPANFLQSRLKIDFLRGHQLWRRHFQSFLMRVCPFLVEDFLNIMTRS
jgi:hypothetical protein